MKNHVYAKNCDCLVCQKGANYMGLLDDRKHTYNGGSQVNSIGLFKGQDKINHADSAGLDKTADYYIDATLRAKEPVKIYSSTDHAKKVLIKEVQKGSIVGEVFSWVKDSAGDLWWQLKEGGFVQHAPGRFDPALATNSSSGKKIETFNKLANAGNGAELLGGLGGLTQEIIKGVIITVIGALIVYILIRKI